MDNAEIRELMTEIQRLEDENEVLKQLLTAYLSYEDKQYIRIKYGIDLGV